ncbi:uncharacterized protein V1518DRAFT_417519 [Limtongia smithiae]|uniref:uncharacterized protein n=1 Tax=Limtongia smithiae TaxID=1125753 RepID=UPI0034CF717B
MPQQQQFVRHHQRHDGRPGYSYVPPSSTTLQWSASPQPRRRLEFSSWNLVLYMCVLTPLICLSNMCSTLKCLFVYAFCVVFKSAHAPPAVASTAAHQPQQDKEKPAELGDNLVRAMLRAELARRLGQMALAHLANIRVRVASDDGDEEEALEEDAQRLHVPRATRGGSQSSSMTESSAGTTPDQISIVEMTGTPARPEPAVCRDSLGSSYEGQRTSTSSPSTASSSTTITPRAPAQTLQRHIRTTRPTLTFSLGTLVLMHILSPLVAIAFLFGGLGAASACLYNFCLGEPTTAADTAYIWRAWARFVCWPATTSADTGSRRRRFSAEGT